MEKLWMKPKRINRAGWILVGIAALVLSLYVYSYGFFKTQCGFRYVNPDPWVGSNNHVYGGYTIWGTVDLTSGKMIKEFRPVRYSFDPDLASMLDDFYSPAKHIDQHLSGWQVSFSEHQPLR